MKISKLVYLVRVFNISMSWTKSWRGTLKWSILWDNIIVYIRVHMSR